jgi:hypothetical protein
MNLPRPTPAPRRFEAIALLLVLTCGAFLAAGRVSYRLDSDTAFQLESVRQWLHGASPSPGFLLLPDPADLSRDNLVWSTWWPPGFPFLYTPLAAAGLRFATALRVTSFLLFLAGALGWLRLADRSPLPRGLRLLYAASLASYAVTLGGAASLRTADILAWAAAPWLIGLALHLGERRPEPPRPALLFLAGLALGATYWMRYSLFLIALPLLAWIALRLVPFLPLSRGKGRLAVLGLGFALPVAALFLLDLRLSVSAAESATGTRSAWSVEDTRSAQPLWLAVSAVGAPGLGLFQNDLWINHLVYFSDARLPFLRGAAPADRLLLKALLGIPATAALAWGLAWARRRRPGPEATLAAVLAAGFYLELLAVSALVGYNYLANEARFAAGFLPLAQPLVLAGWRETEGWLRRALGALCIAVLCLAPIAFAAANFVKNDLRDRAAAGCAPSPSGLFTPELACRGLPAVQAAVAETLGSSPGVVLLAGPQGWGSSFLMWLEVPQRTLPVATFISPLGARYRDAADLHGTGPLVTSRPLRVVLLAERSLAADGLLAALEARFPQAGPWRSVPLPEGSAVTLVTTDLRPR